MTLKTNLMSTASPAALPPLRPRGAATTATETTSAETSERPAETRAAPALPVRRAEDDAGDEDDEDDKDKDKKNKAKKAEDDDDGDKKDDDDENARSARARERGKIRAILDSPAGKAAFSADPEKTMAFVLDFPGTRAAAIATLNLFGGNLRPAARPALRERTAEVPAAPGPGAVTETATDGFVVGMRSDSPGYDPSKVAAAIVQSGKIRRGEAA